MNRLPATRYAIAEAKLHLGDIDALVANGVNVRWTRFRKLALVTLIRHGELGRVDAQRRYGISTEELLSWERRYMRHGTEGLAQRKIQQLRVQ